MKVLYRRTVKRCVNRRAWAKLAERAGDVALLVNWEDINGNGSWRSFDDISKDSLVRMFTAGWVVAVNDDRLILVSTRYSVLDQKKGGDSTVIPIGCIVRVTKL